MHSHSTELRTWKRIESRAVFLPRLPAGRPPVILMDARYRTVAQWRMTCAGLEARSSSTDVNPKAARLKSPNLIRGPAKQWSGPCISPPFQGKVVTLEARCGLIIMVTTSSLVRPDTLLLVYVQDKKHSNPHLSCQPPTAETTPGSTYRTYLPIEAQLLGF